MEEINFTDNELNSFEIFNKGGFEGKILFYKEDLLIKKFEDYLRSMLDIENKRYKLIEFSKINISDNIISVPKKIVNKDNNFIGYTMKKYDAITIDNFSSYKQLLNLYTKLFKNMEYLHKKDIIIGDVKQNNIIVDINNNPIFVDVDSMGIKNLEHDHKDIGARGFQTRIPGIEKKMLNNDYKSVDKLLLLACFVENLCKGNKPMIEKIYSSSLSNEAKDIINECLSSNYIDYGLNIAAILEKERNR